MTFIINNADASFYYHEDSAMDLARMDSSAIYGNRADAMKNATVLLPSPHIIRVIMVSPPCPDNKQVDIDPVKGHGNDGRKTSGNKNGLQSGRWINE